MPYKDPEVRRVAAAEYARRRRAEARAHGEVYGTSGKKKSLAKRIEEMDPALVPTLLCLNCDRPIDDLRWPYLYCSELCKEKAKYVRYYRGVLADGRVRQPDVQEALETRLAMIVGGGYPGRERSISPALRKTIIERDGYSCRICGAPGEEIDHISAHVDNVNHPDNLQLLCAECHAKKTRAGFRIVTQESDPEEWERCQTIALELERRVYAVSPERPCDDGRGWETGWRTLAAQRRESLSQSVSTRRPR